MGRAIYPHQRIVIIHRCDLPNDERYTSDGDLAVINAMRRMTGNQSSGFYLWNVLRMNEDGFQLAMSDARLKSVYNMSEKIYRSGWSILQAEGFIQLVNGRTYDRKFRTSKNTFTVNQEQSHGVLGTPSRRFRNAIIQERNDIICKQNRLNHSLGKTGFDKLRVWAEPSVAFQLSLAKWNPFGEQ